TRPETICPLTLSHTVLVQMLNSLETKEADESYTNISDALVVGLHRLETTAPTSSKALILLTDGEDNVKNNRPKWTQRQLAQLAANKKIPIFTIDARGDTATTREPATTAQAASVPAPVLAAPPATHPPP